MSNSPFLDTNIFVYAFTDDIRTARAQALLAEPYVTSVQAFNEFAHVMRRKSRRDWSEIRTALSAIRRMSESVIVVDLALNDRAFDLIEKYNLAFFDALMVAAALEARCTVFLSEDLQNGMVIDGKLTITNPFL
ncbi:Predicted nucleic acid-binding protein, contains PIN domain [Rhizobium sp. NFR07]|uniref:PIN domain-containing protein n=1 Tax=Rhizobium sp. NFR07 TaxID=1566262 RepID=UPI0008E417F9|nr:PIN domain-containing protein [Rhizobium sp. NFR07]SFB07330.1 Predicted nucleic acid-binding protein, contains PIN domain [Rhizobium sp. NFR07]